MVFNKQEIMTIEKAAGILRKYNEWLRADEDTDLGYTPSEIGMALDVATDILERSIVRTDIDSIIQAVTRETGVTEAEMLAKGRQREYSEARAIVSWLAYNYTSMTLTAIGRRFGRDHATAIYYNKTVSYWLSSKANQRGAKITRKLIKELSND
jgi:chromosomal replication initiation ATPase DnaA